MTPREESIAAAQYLAREADRVARRLAVLRDQLEDLHHAWDVMHRGTANQASREVLIRLADAEQHAGAAAGQASEAAQEMQGYAESV